MNRFKHYTDHLPGTPVCVAYLDAHTGILAHKYKEENLITKHGCSGVGE